MQPQLQLNPLPLSSFSKKDGQEADQGRHSIESGICDRDRVTERDDWKNGFHLQDIF